MQFSLKGRFVHNPCVLFITVNSLLSLALANLSNASESDLVLIESSAQNFDELKKEINTYTADVILVDKSNYFAGEKLLTNLLMFYPKLLVIVVSEEDNWLHTYRREDILLTSTEDLLDVIQKA